ncbi:alkaline phosphatase [Fulvivirga sediminis]|uniref:Alkaline phosphatase n=1 Tax=Fulvivirga sediminis TaxID=2803949 RepID=A0A937JYN5_9BACT|nr:alkaline phosphatase [Fulvivirga sediminis]MBL3655854.1 alkaline phosphatase [Fulvivirga sediminis]
MTFNKLFSIGSILTVFLLFNCSQNQESQSKSSEQADKNDKPLNVIFMIGDGMGLPQITSSFYYKGSPSNFERFKNIGFIKTSSKSNKVTDSAAGASAFATGNKTYNRAISVSTDTTNMPTILEKLEAKNYKTGLISLTSITHATPACFYAHVKDRDMHEDIATQLLTSGTDFFAGGGLKYFSKRTDGRNLFDEFEKAGYTMDSTGLKSDLDANKKYGFVLAEDGIPAKIEGRGDYLLDATKLALDHLSASDSGYFLMVEGSYIDWGGHAKNAEMMVTEMLDFDKTLGYVLDYVEKHENTLLVVTADHETGGVAIGKSDRADSVAVYFTTDQHTAELIPVFSKGDHEDSFRGIYENNEINHKLAEALGNIK